MYNSVDERRRGILEEIEQVFLSKDFERTITEEDMRFLTIEMISNERELFRNDNSLNGTRLEVIERLTALENIYLKAKEIADKMEKKRPQLKEGEISEEYVKRLEKFKKEEKSAILKKINTEEILENFNAIKANLNFSWSNN